MAKRSDQFSGRLSNLSILEERSQTNLVVGMKNSHILAISIGIAAIGLLIAALFLLEATWIVVPPVVLWALFVSYLIFRVNKSTNEIVLDKISQTITVRRRLPFAGRDRIYPLEQVSEVRCLFSRLNIKPDYYLLLKDDRRITIYKPVRFWRNTPMEEPALDAVCVVVAKFLDVPFRKVYFAGLHTKHPGENEVVVWPEPPL